MSKPKGMTAWLVQDAVVPDDLVLEIFNSPSPEEETIRKRIAAGQKLAALAWLLIIGRKRLWCAFVEGFADLQVTSIGRVTLSALLNLSAGVSSKAPIVLNYIQSPHRFERLVGRVLSGAPDGSLVCFLGDVTGALDRLELAYLDQIGNVRAAVGFDTAGPLEWWPLSDAS